MWRHSFKWVKHPGQNKPSEMLDPNRLRPRSSGQCTSAPVLRAVIENGKPVIELEPEYQWITMVPQLVQIVRWTAEGEWARELWSSDDEPTWGAGSIQAVFYSLCGLIDELLHMARVDTKWSARFCWWSHRYDYDHRVSVLEQLAEEMIEMIAFAEVVGPRG